MLKKLMPVSFSASTWFPLAARMTSIRRFIVTVILVILALSAATVVNAAETQEIELTDGSMINGEVVSLSEGIYTIKSATLGTLRIEASKIRVIRLTGPAATNDARGQVKSLEDRMLEDRGIMDTIRALQADPDLQKILQDPEIMKAVQSGDIDFLMKSPDFMKLLNKESVQDINKKLTR